MNIRHVFLHFSPFTRTHTDRLHFPSLFLSPPPFPLFSLYLSSLSLSSLSLSLFSRFATTATMPPRGGRFKKVMVQPITLIFRFLQQVCVCFSPLFCNTSNQHKRTTAFALLVSWSLRFRLNQHPLRLSDAMHPPPTFHLSF